MPIMQIHIPTDEGRPFDFAPLLKEASDYYCDTLYPGVDPRPIERVRVYIQTISPQFWATAGVLVSQGGAIAPYFTVLALSGRPREQLDSLMSGLTSIVAQNLDCEEALIRGQVIEVEPANWFIGGLSATQARSGETAIRKVGFDPSQ